MSATLQGRFLTTGPPGKSLFTIFLKRLRNVQIFSSVVVVQSLGRVQLSTTLWTAACQASLSFTISWSWLKLMSIELVMPSKFLSSVIPFSFCPQSFPASGSFPVTWLSTSGGQSIGSFGISPSSEYSGLISYRIDWGLYKHCGV